MQSSVGRDKAALVRVDIASGKATVLGASEAADVENVWLEPKTASPQAYTVNYLKPTIAVLNPSVQKDVDLLTKQLGDGFSVTNRTLDDSMWTVVTDDARAPATAYLYDRKAGTVTKLFEQRPALAKSPLVPMQALELKARDGLTLVSYLSLPPGSDANGDGFPDKPVPLVLNVQGGPWGRDTYGFDNEHQWLANRGYAVLGELPRLHRFRKGFVNAANKEGRQDARRPVRCTRAGAGEEDHSPDKIAIYGVRMALRHAGRPDVHARCSPAAWTSSVRRISTLLASIPLYGKPSTRNSRSASATRALRRAKPPAEHRRSLMSQPSPSRC